jgi:hypothetical protein
MVSVSLCRRAARIRTIPAADRDIDKFGGDQRARRTAAMASLNVGSPLSYHAAVRTVDSNLTCSTRSTTAAAFCRSICSGKPVAIFLRPGKTPDGAKVARVQRHVPGRIRARWPRVEILVRGDGHYGRIEAITWCRHNRVA